MAGCGRAPLTRRSCPYRCPQVAPGGGCCNHVRCALRGDAPNVVEMLEGSLLTLDVLGMLLVMFWCIRQERAPEANDEQAKR